MANRTQIVCLHEGEKGRSIDPVFITKLETIDPADDDVMKGVG